MPRIVAASPPESLLAECPEPAGDYAVFMRLQNNDIAGAARAHAEYVLNARDALDLCNSRLRGIRKFYEGIK